MRNYLNTNLACTGQIQKYIGSSYDIVKLVADNMDKMHEIIKGIESGTFDEIIKLRPDLEELLKQLKFFGNIYYGSLPDEPKTRPDGSNMQGGDLYYNSTKETLFVREGGHWVPVGAVENYVQVIEVEEDHFRDLNGKIGKDATLHVGAGFNIGLNNMLVFVNSTYQSCITNTNPNGAYFEKDPYHIVFPGPGLQLHDKVTVIVGKIVTTIGHSISVETEVYQTIIPDERVIMLPRGMQYNPGLRDLEIFINGLLQINGIDYTETDKTHITLTKNISAGSLIVFKKGDIASSGWARGYSESFTKIEILNVASDFYARNRTLPNDALIILKGYSLPSDGGEGVFIYDPTMNRRSANGGTVIDATVGLTVQGNGVGSGCWVRQYAEVIHPQWWGYDNALVSRLLDLGEAQDGDVIAVSGFHENGDGGQGEFYWDANEPRRNHDGGIIINPEADFPGQWNNGTQMRHWFSHPFLATGCWVRKHREEANICWFGAIGDGNTDNAYVFEGMSRAVAESHLTRLFIPKGTFLMKTPETFLVEGFDGEFILYGDQKASRIQLAAGAVTSPIVFRESTGITIRDFTYADTRTTVPTVGISLQNCNDVQISNMQFVGIDGNVIEIRENKKTNTGDVCNNILIERNEFYSCCSNGEAVIYVEPMKLSRNALIDDNWIYQGVGANSAAIKAGCAMEDAIIRGNRIDDISGDGIVTEAYMNVEIESNTIQNFAGNAIKILAATAKTFLTPSLEYCGCKNNHISIPNVNALVADYGIRIEGDTNTIGLLIVSDNTFVKCAGIVCQPQAPLKNIILDNNKIQEVPLNLIGILADNTKGAAPEDIQISDNFVENEDLTRANCLISLQSCLRAVIRDNYLKRSGDYDIRLQDCSDSVVLGNVFHEPNVNNAAGGACIEVADAHAVPYRIKNNHVLTGRIGHPVALVTANSNLPVIYLTGNTIDDPAIPIAANVNVNFGNNAEDMGVQMGNLRHFYGTAVPVPPGVKGNYEIGDIIWNTAPVAGGTVGWICVTAGNPGTWKTFGSIGV